MFALLPRLFVDRLCFWLVCWVFLADALLQLATFTSLDLSPLLAKANDWLEGCGDDT